MKLLYNTFIDTADRHGSGSTVRAKKMLAAFEECGAEVMLLEGWNRKDTRLERSMTVRTMRERLRTERPDACYVELPSGPLFCREDYALLRWLHAEGIPIAYFYGDAYWRFPAYRQAEGHAARRGATTFAKDALIYWMQRYCWRLYRATASIIYFPSASMAALFDAPRAGVSFPGSELLRTELLGATGEDVTAGAGAGAADAIGATADAALPGGAGGAGAALPNLAGAPPTGIYVGGASMRYGTPLLLDAFAQANDSGTTAHLILVCPPDQWEALPKESRRHDKSPWLQRRQAVGDDQLAPLYRQADFACLPLRRNVYNDFAMSIKLFEYLSYHKPILATTVREMSVFIESNRVGIVCEDNVPSYACGLTRMTRDHSLRAQLRTRCVRVCAENTWQHRALAILADLEGLLIRHGNQRSEQEDGT
jgi:glycosyltransferase involved in cell wall biosynthesis